MDGLEKLIDNGVINVLKKKKTPLNINVVVTVLKERRIEQVNEMFNLRNGLLSDF